AVRGGRAAEEVEPLAARLNLTALGSGGAAESYQLSIDALRFWVVGHTCLGHVITSRTTMQVFRFLSPEGPRLGLDIEGERYDLSAAASEFADVSSWLSLSDPVAAVHKVLARSRDFPISDELELLAPLDVQE